MHNCYGYKLVHTVTIETETSGLHVKQRVGQGSAGKTRQGRKPHPNENFCGVDARYGCRIRSRLEETC
jgi:hypothetical protein